MLESQTALQPPNGGYGWVVVFGAILVNMFHKGIFSVYGLIFGTMFSENNISQSDISLALKLASFISSFSAVLSGVILKYFSVRQISICACLILSTGISLSAFTVSGYQIVLTFSFLVGIGQGLLTNTTLIAVTDYFTTNRRRAVSFSMAGSGIGQIALPQIVKYLNNNFNYKLAIPILGAITLIGTVGAFLFQPVQKYLIERKIDESQPLRPKSRHKDTVHHNNQENPSFWNKIVNKMDLELLKNPHFITLIFVLACNYAVVIDFTLILPFFLQEEANLSGNEAAVCLSVLATFDMLSRLSFHFITDRINLSNRQVLVAGLVITGVLKIAMTFLTSYIYILILCSIYGYIRSIVIVNQIIELSDHCLKYYPEKYPGALGLQMGFYAISVITIGQLFGSFRNIISNYSYSLYLQVIFVMSVLSVWFVEYLCDLMYKVPTKKVQVYKYTNSGSSV